MQRNYTRKKSLAGLLTTSGRIHKIEMMASASEVARIKQTFIKLYSELPAVRHERKALL